MTFFSDYVPLWRRFQGWKKKLFDCPEGVSLDRGLCTSKVSELTPEMGEGRVSTQRRPDPGASARSWSGEDASGGSQGAGT